MRESFETVQKRLEFSVLLGSGLVQMYCFRSKLHVDCFACGFIGPLKIGSMAFGRMVATGALGFAALDHALEHRSFAEVLQLLELLF